MSIYETAYSAMQEISEDKSLCHLYATLARFLEKYPEMAVGLKDGNITPAYLAKKAAAFKKGRVEHPPSLPETIPDERIADILQHFYSVDASSIEDAIEHHMQSMSAENIIGHLLESYIASVAEKEGWIWCSGTTVKHIDFIKPLNNFENWQTLQIKNRDNSENSSSASVRDGTDIMKWFRTYSRTGKTNWENFPDTTLKGKLSEDNFKDYVIQYLKRMKK